jgi:AraC family transcriptional regulator
MRAQAQAAKIIDYRKANAANPLLPNPSVLSSSGWQDVHLEIFQQPEFEITEHQHTMHVIACGLPCPMPTRSPTDSSGERWLDGKLIREKRHNGDIAIIPADVLHRCNWNASVQFMVLALEPALLQHVGQDWVNRDRIELIPQFMNQQDVFIQGIFFALRQELELGGIGGYLLTDSLKTALAIHLLRNYCTTSPKLFSYSEGLSQIKLALVTDYIHDHLQQDLSLKEIAAIAQISQYHFSRLFKQKMGITLHQYILQRRIERAKELLQHSQLSIADIALRVGFCDQSHLNRSFKRILGVTPKQFLKA